MRAVVAPGRSLVVEGESPVEGGDSCFAAVWAISQVLEVALTPAQRGGQLSRRP